MAPMSKPGTAGIDYHLLCQSCDTMSRTTTLPYSPSSIHLHSHSRLRERLGSMGVGRRYQQE